MKTPHLLRLGWTLLLLNPLTAFAVTDTWDGNGGVGLNNNLNNDLNWQDDTAPASDLINTDLIFSTTNKLTLNVSVAFAADSITFDNTAGAFVFGGQAFSIGTTGVRNDDVQPMTFNNEVKFDGVANSTISAASGDLIFTNLVTLPTGMLSVTGGDGTSFADISGSSALSKSDTGTMTYTPTLATNFDLTVSAGTITIGADGGTDIFNTTSSVAVNGTSILNINENLTLEGQLTRATGADVNIAAGKTLTVQNGGDVTITGNYSPGSAATTTVTGVGSTFSTSGVVDLNGGSTTNVLAGASYSSGSALRVGNTTNATLTADGSGSSASGTTLNLGLLGGAGSFTLTNGASGTFSSTINVDNSPNAGNSGTLSIQSGSSVSGTGLFIAPTAAANTGTVTITGTDSALTVTGAGTATIGAASASTGTLNVNSSGTFNSGTGLTTVNATGTIAIGGGTYNSNGNLTLDGGELTRSNTGVLALDPGTTFTVQGGGDATITGAFTNNTASTITITGSGSTFSAVGGVTLGGSMMNVLAGGDLSLGAASLSLGGAGTGTVVVDGSGSSLSGGVSVGGTGAAGELTFSNASTGTLGVTRVAFSLVANTSGTMQIQSGADVTCTGFSVAELTGTNVTGIVTVTGSGSSLTLAEGPIFTVGATGNSTGTVNVQSGGILAGTAGTMRVNTTGTIAITGGTYNSSGADLLLNGGQFTRDAAGTFTLGAGQEFRVQGGGDATFTGGYINATASTIIVTGAGSTLSTTSSLQLNGGGTLNVTSGADVTSGSLISIGGAGTGTVTVDGAGSTFSGIDLSFGAGSAGTSTLAFSNNSAGAFASITMAASPVAGGGGTLSIASGADVTATSLSVATFNTAKTGTLTVTGAGSTFTLTGASGANIGAANTSSGTVTVESGGTFTTSTGAVFVNATGALNIDAGGTLTGAADFAGGGPINLAGAYLPGAASGASQTTEASFAQNITLQPTTSITLEIGGLTVGTQHDRIAFNGGGNPHITWNGTLNVVLINGFAPQNGDSFDLFNFDPARDAGAFSTINLPALSLGFFWRTDLLYNSGQIFVSAVPGSYAEWESAYNVTGGFGGDDDLDGVPNGIEFLLGTNPKAAFAAGEYPIEELKPGTGDPLVAAVTFVIPSVPPSDAHYRVYASDDLDGWTLIASRNGTASWATFETAMVLEDAPVNGRTRVTISEELPAAITTRRFHRLEAEAP